MKILSVNNTADLYGASRCMERLHRRLVLAGHEVHAVLPSEGPLADLLEAGGVRVHIQSMLSIVDRYRMRSPLGALGFSATMPVSIYHLAGLIRRLHIDLVHTNSVVLPSAALAAAVTRVPHVWHIRELLTEFGPLWRPLQYAVVGLSGKVIAVSECVRQQFSPTLQGKVKVIYDGLGEEASLVNEQSRATLRSRFPNDALLVGLVGRIKLYRKGQEVLVRAANLLKARHPNAQFVLAGSPAPNSPEELDKLQALIDELGVRDKITLLGDVDDPASLFAALDVAVVPSVQPEPFGCVVIEAMAVGTPVIGSNCGGIAEQIVHGETGLLFAPGDAAALADALDRMLSDAQLRSRIARQALVRVKACWRVEDTFDQAERTFAEVARSVRRNNFYSSQVESRPRPRETALTNANLIGVGNSQQSVEQVEECGQS